MGQQKANKNNQPQKHSNNQQNESETSVDLVEASAGPEVEAMTDNETTQISESVTADTQPHMRTHTQSNEEAPLEEPTSEKEQVRIEFPYSDLLRSQAPKAFEVAEKLATDWKNEGDFSDLGITHPVAGMAAAAALTKAKEVEKKLEEKGVISMAKLGLAIAKSQVENIKSKINK